MARYGGGYGGDFYSGPSPFEALVGQALSTFEERKEAKRRKAIEDAQREEQSTTTRLAQAQQRAQLSDQGYGAGPGGEITRTGLSKEDQRYTREQAAKVAERGQKRNDATGFAMGVGAIMGAKTPEEKKAAYDRTVLYNPEAAAGLADKAFPPTPKAPGLSKVVGPNGVVSFVEERPGIAMRDGQPVRERIPPGPAAPKDDRETWVKQRFRDNLQAQGAFGFGKLYQSPEEAMAATQKEADQLFGSKGPLAPKLVKPPTVRTATNDVPTLDDLEGEYQRSRRK